MRWRRLRALVRREILATFRDPFTVAILVSVPLVALLLFGFVLSTEVKHLSLGVLDAAGTSASRAIVADLTAKGTFDAHPYTTREELEEALVSGDIGVGLVIPPDLDRNLRNGADADAPPEIQVLYDGGEAVLAGNAEAFLRSLIGANAPRLASREGSLAGDSLRARASHRIEVVTRSPYNPRLEGKPFMVAGTFGFVLSFVTTLITAVSIVNERLSGTFEQLQVTPATSAEILLGKILPLGAAFTFDVILMVLVAGFVLGVWPIGSTLFFVIVSIFYVLISLSLGLIFSATSATAAEAVQKTVLFSIPLIQLSGFVFPIRNMPLAVRWAAEIFPATHYIRVSRAIYLRAATPLTVLPDLALLLIFGVLLIAFTLRSLEARA